MKFELDFSREDAPEGLLPNAFASALAKQFGNASVAQGVNNKTKVNFAFFANSDDFLGAFGRVEARVINHTIGISPNDKIHKRFFVDAEVESFKTYKNGFTYALCCVFFPALIWYKRKEKDAVKKLNAKMKAAMDDVQRTLANGPQAGDNY